MVKVLVAEDDRHVRELLVDTLFDAGYDVLEAKDGKAAVKQTCQEHPDLVLLDIWMPYLDGFEVLSKLREDPATESIPVVLLTALPAVQGEQKGMGLGALHYITKPWTRGVVEATVRIALRESHAGPAEENDDSVVWAGSTSYQRTTDDVDRQDQIRTAARLTPLEKIIGGGLSLGTLTLIEGATSAGKSVICQHLAYGALTEGHSVVYFTSEHTRHRLSKQLTAIGLDVSEFLGNDQLSIYPVQEPVQGEDSGALLLALAVDLERLPKSCKFIVVDAVTGLAGSSQEQDILGFFSSLRRQSSKGRTIAVVAHSYAFSEQMLARLSAMCDSHFRLRTGKFRAKLVHMLEVQKANGIELDRDNQLVFEVEAGAGARIIPMSRAKV